MIGSHKKGLIVAAAALATLGFTGLFAHASSNTTAADTLGQAQKRRLDLGPVERVPIERMGMTDRLRRARIGDDIAILVDPLRPQRDGRAMLAETGLEKCRVRVREVANGPHPKILEDLTRLRADTPEA